MISDFATMEAISGKRRAQTMSRSELPLRRLSMITAGTLITGLIPELLLAAQDGLAAVVNPLNHLKINSGLSALILAFAGGVLSSLTPCVYPLIPVALAIGSSTPEASRRRSFLRALIYVSGMVISFTILGLIAAQTGLLFGAFLAHPAVLAGIVILLLVLGCHTLEIFNLRILDSVQTKAGALRGRGIAGIFIAGALSGFLASPCVGPLLVAILGIAASSQEWGWGGLLLFCYGLGFGLLFLILGTFSSVLTRLPRSGSWMQVVKFSIALAIFTILFFLAASTRQFSLPEISTLAALLLLLCALLLGYAGYRWNLKAGRLGGALLAAVMLQQILLPIRPIAPGREHQPQTILSALRSEWLPSLSAGLERARREQKLVLVDFYADWCLLCKELQHKTLDQPELQNGLNRFILVRVDVSSPNAEQQDLFKRYSVIGLPLIIFLNPNGEELANTRITGFMDAASFEQHIAEIDRNWRSPKALATTSRAR